MQRRHFIRTAAAACCIASAAPGRADNAPGDKELLLGQSAVLSGPLGATVKEFSAGAQLAFTEANASGGVAGRQIKLVSMDDELRPDLAVINYRRLLEEQKVFAFFGCVGSGTVAATADILKTSGTPSVGCYGVADSAREKVRGHGFLVRASNAREVNKLVQQLKIVGTQRIAATSLDNAGGKEVLQLFEKTLAAEGLTLAASALVKGDGSNIAEAARTLVAAQPQAVLMYLSGALPGGVIDAMRKGGSAPIFYGTSLVQGNALAKVLGAGARGVTISQIIPYPWKETDAELSAYARLCARAKMDVSYLNLEGYINGRVMVEALTRSGRALTQSKLLATLNALRMRIAGMDIDFTDPQALAGSRFVELVLVTETGRYVR